MCLDACNILFSQTCLPWHTRTPPMALAQVSAGSTRRHTGRTRPTGVCGDHVGGPGTYARAQAAMALAAHASVRPPRVWLPCIALALVSGGSSRWHTGRTVPS